MLQISMINKDLEEANLLYEELITQMKDENIILNNRSKSILADYYLRINEIDKADFLYKELLNYNPGLNYTLFQLFDISMAKLDFEQAEYYLNQIDTNDNNRNNVILGKIYIEIYRHNYLKAYEMLKMIDSVNENKDLESKIQQILYFIMNRLKIHTVLPPDITYGYVQSYCYDEEQALKHIKMHINPRFLDIKSQFSQSISILNLYKKIQNMLDPKYIIYVDSRIVYLIPYPNCGISNGKSMNYIKVVTLFDTGNILTMFPSDNNAYLEEENEYIEQPEKTKLKRLSQIEKFNKKYNL